MELSPSLSFQQEIVSDLDTDGCLCLLASGLGWHKPVASLLRGFCPSPQDSVFLLGFRPPQKTALRKELGDEGQGLREINAAVSITERSRLYQAGCCCFITTRILVVDLLCGRLRTESVHGMVILNAHTVTDDSGDAFAIRLLLKQNKRGFVHAFSDQPGSFSSGIRKAEEVMRSLRIHRLSLWPRFQASVKANLETVPIQIIEVAQPLTKHMMLIQEAIKEIVQSLLTDLKRTNTFDSSELTVENTLFRSFDKLAKRQLDLVWHTTTWKTKQLVEDLKQLRELLSDLLTHDAITFLSFLEKIKATGGESIWMFHNAAHEIYENAKQRVYLLSFEEPKRPKRAKTESKSYQQEKKPVIQPILEKLPKWDALREIINEIQLEDQSSTDQDRILIVCKEMFLSPQLKLALQDPDQLMKQLFEEYLVARNHAENKTKYDKKGKRSHTTKKCDLSLYSNTELWKAELETIVASEAQALDELNQESQGKMKKSKKLKKPRDEKQEEETGESGRPSLLYNAELWESNVNAECLQNVYFYTLDSKEECVLSEIHPSHIILYHSDIGFMRQIEVYQAEHPDHVLKIFQIYYDESIEKEKFEISVRRENDIFGELIQQKGRILIPNDLNDDLLELKFQQGEGDRVAGVEASNALTRRGGLSSALAPKRKIIVDMREFMSRLPAILHKSAFELQPMTLEVGDYILAPGLIVERKSLADLASSLKSGRLYHQVEAMVKKFEFPVLLIEFEAAKQFRLQSDEELGNSVSSQHLSSKLALLVLHFSKLKLVWSQSPQTTCEIFQNFKKTRPDPTLPNAPNLEEQEVTNYTAVEILKKLPGITESNFHKVMKSCHCLSSLCNQDLASLTEILESSKNATLLFNFLHHPCPKW